jgi:hypothetical protein
VSGERFASEGKQTARHWLQSCATRWQIDAQLRENFSAKISRVRVMKACVRLKHHAPYMLKSLSACDMDFLGAASDVTDKTVI